MYNEFFGFQENPFNVTPNPRFFYADAVHKEAYASLVYGIQERKGFVTLIGEAGTGKTTLLRRLMISLAEPNEFVYLCYSTPSFEEFLTFICVDLGLEVEGKGYLGKIQLLNNFLLSILQKGGTGILLVDEAQNLGESVLENLRLLSNIETATEKLLQIVLVGQPELEKKLAQPNLRQLKQRVAVQCRLDRLKEREVGPFIFSRLRTAGYDKKDLFPPATIQRIALYSKGTPRLINILCDNALLIAYSASRHEISPEMVDEVARDLQLRVQTTPREENNVRSVVWQEEASRLREQTQDLNTNREFLIEKGDVQREERGPSFPPPRITPPPQRSTFFYIGIGALLAFLLLPALGIIPEHVAATLRSMLVFWQLPTSRLPGENEPPVQKNHRLTEQRADTPPSRETQETPDSSVPPTALAGQPPLSANESPVPQQENREELRQEESPLLAPIPTRPMATRETESASSVPQQENREELRQEESPLLAPTPTRPTATRETEDAPFIVVPSGTTILEIVRKNYQSANILAVDVLKEMNPHLEDLDHIQIGEKIWLPPLNQETLMRQEPDGLYRLVVGSFRSLIEAEQFSQKVKAQGYRVRVLPHRISRRIVLQRVEIYLLENRDAVNRAWESFPVRNALQAHAETNLGEGSNTPQ
jgi:general secretion pathway protein A